MTWAGRWLEAERYHRRAFELGLDPASVPGYALLHWTVGRFEEAIPEYETYLGVDPMDRIAASLLMMMYELVGDEDARQRALDRGERLYGVWPVGAESLLIGLAEGDDERMRAWATESFGRQGIPVNVPGVANLDSRASAIEALRGLYDELDLSSASVDVGVSIFFLSA